MNTLCFKRIAASMAAMALPVAASLACTDLIAGKKATVDGSVIASYAADSHTLYGELYHQPAADHAPGTMRKVVEWDTGKPLGEIPEIAHTFATYGNMNEHGLTISESTWGGRPELEGTGTIDYGSLIYITLQRAKTADAALDTMISLVDRYGYASSGESFTIADADHAWIMEMIGKGKAGKGAVWVARRVPDDCISGHANHARIHQFPLNDTPDQTRYSADVIDFARSQGYYPASGKDADFSFSLAYAGKDSGSLRGCDARVWSYFNRHSDGAEAYLPWILEGDESALMPLWVKPSKPVSVRDVQAMMRDHFEDTPFDMTTDIGAGPYKVPYRWRPMSFEVDSVEYLHERAIATQQTGFSFVSQMRDDVPDAMKAILWFGCDDANTCVYVPIFCGITEVPHAFAVGNGDLYNVSWDANFWVNTYVANQAYHRYDRMIPDIRRVQNGLEDAMHAEADSLVSVVAALAPAEASALLTERSKYWATKATADYKALGDYLLVKFSDGNIKRQNPDGTFLRTETGMPASPEYGGYDEQYFRSIVNDPNGGERLRVKKI